ncbi:methyltransferase family protein [Tsuneonella mangrovi]|uniref:methyltransferase family protein n=1 Tax=Tsuneonella mangrovi TaxID=1982042 RepID=UPI000BA1D580|nr:isoprenylcysteine carboxylmethyltransferase family protein [Tsuneonella mangrovi]
MSEQSASLPAQRPASDVSAAVGLAGLAGLFVWVMFCRHWPYLVDTFGLPGPHARLDGPYAALTSLVFVALPMVAVSLIKDKVHLRPSTGIDWARPHSLAEVAEVSIIKLGGLWATWAGIGLMYGLARWYWSGDYLFAMEVIGYAAAPLFVLSIPYVLWLDRYLVNPRDHAWHFGAMLLRHGNYDIAEVKKHWRAWIIKGFFGAFMISILPGGFQGVVNTDFGAIAANPVEIGMALVSLLFLIDVQVGTVGYLVTMRPLDAHIRSGNPFLAGWVAALLCYPPLNGIGVLDYGVGTPGMAENNWTFWFAGHPGVMWVWAALLTGLTGYYAWATVAFGLRFSNLTYRGVITNGPYAFTRHPAYLAKNTFWWLSTLPFLVTDGSTVDAVRNGFFLACVSGIYYWRARTEEMHLLSEDAKYRAYHAWMAEHGAITARLRKLLRGEWLRRPAAPAIPEPAE